MDKRNDTEQIVKRLDELAERARRTGRPVYTPFLSPSDAALSYKAASEGEIYMWGGTEGAERVRIRFGLPEEMEEEPFPITLLMIRPKQSKFADALTHRDFLGAILHLGLERDSVGDILVRGASAYAFVCDEIAGFITENLTTVKHTSVCCEICGELPEDVRPRLEECEISIASARLDGIIAGVFHLSRSKAKELFPSESVFLDGKLCKNADTDPDEESVVSVRGYGKFIFHGKSRETRKGRQVVRISLYK